MKGSNKLLIKNPYIYKITYTMTVGKNKTADAFIVIGQNSNEIQALINTFFHELAINVVSFVSYEIINIDSLADNDENCYAFVPDSTGSPNVIMKTSTDCYYAYAGTMPTYIFAQNMLKAYELYNNFLRSIPLQRKIHLEKISRKAMTYYYGRQARNKLVVGQSNKKAAE